MIRQLIAAVILAAGLVSGRGVVAELSPGEWTGIEIRLDLSPYRWQGDFDRDGKPDFLYAVNLTSRYRASSKIRLLNFWGRKPLTLPENLALKLVSSRHQQDFLLYSESYFDSPIWRGKQLPIVIVRRGTVAHQNWAKQIKGLQGDGILLPTEAGIDTLLYWDGRTYRLYQPAESP